MRWLGLLVGLGGLYLMSKSAKKSGSGGGKAQPYNKERLARWWPLYVAQGTEAWPTNYLAAQGIIESGLTATAVSSTGAAGIAQFMPNTGRAMGLRVEGTVRREGSRWEWPNPAKDPVLDERFNPHRAIPAQARLMNTYVQRYGNREEAVAAYRSGSGAVARRGISEGDWRYIRWLFATAAAVKPLT